MIHYPIKPFLLSHSFGKNQSQEQPTPSDNEGDQPDD